MLIIYINFSIDNLSGFSSFSCIFFFALNPALKKERNELSLWALISLSKNERIIR